jgi:RNA polymerase-binding transcription factor DksA
MRVDQQIKERLLHRRRDLLSRYHDELARADEELASRETEQVEHATELWDARVLSRLGDADAHALARLVGALRRIEQGGYGACVDCGGAIDPARLTAIPEAATCFDCAVTAERAGAQAR